MVVDRTGCVIIDPFLWECRASGIVKPSRTVVFFPEI